MQCVDEARREVERLISALVSFVRRGVPVIGLEPSSLLTLKDEIPAMLPGADADFVAENTMRFEEFFVGNPLTRDMPLRPLNRQNLLHGHCHQKAHNLMSFAKQALELIPNTK
jgi:Fe-S oxidoreductase